MGETLQLNDVMDALFGQSATTTNALLIGGPRHLTILRLKAVVQTIRAPDLGPSRCLVEYRKRKYIFKSGRVGCVFVHEDHDGSHDVFATMTLAILGLAAMARMLLGGGEADGP